MARKKLENGAPAVEERVLGAASDAERTAAPVDSPHCLPERTDLVVTLLRPAEDQLLYKMCDARGDLVFYATCDDSDFGFWEAVLHDTTGRPIIVLKGERVDAFRGVRSTWMACREPSEQVRILGDSNLLFTAVQSTKKLKSSFDVFVPNREGGDPSQSPHFTARTKLFGRGFKLVHRDPGSRRQRRRVAKARRRTCFNLPCCNFGEDEHRIRISASVDRAFVASIFVLVDLAGRRRSWSSSSPTIAEPAEFPIALGIPASSLDSRGMNSEEVGGAAQWSPAEAAFQVYSSYHRMYAPGHECSEKHNGSRINQLGACPDHQRQDVKSTSSPAEDAFRAYQVQHKMYVLGHGAKL